MMLFERRGEGKWLERLMEPHPHLLQQKVNKRLHLLTKERRREHVV